MFNPLLTRIRKNLNVRLSIYSRIPNGEYVLNNDCIRFNLDTKVNYDRLLAHELIHSTGHHKRLNRSLLGEVSRQLDLGQNLGAFRWDKQSYCDEEQVAEWGGFLLLNRLGIEVVNQEEITRDYLKSYGSVDGRPSIYAEIQAQKAVEYLVRFL